jgi:hypothetical protein
MLRRNKNYRFDIFAFEGYLLWNECSGKALRSVINLLQLKNKEDHDLKFS